MKTIYNNKKPDISVCIVTFLRPDKLKRLLESLLRLRGIEEFSYEVIVVDNDAERTARNIVESFKNKFDFLKYCVEPQQNIALARNCAVRESRGEWIAFIDDDEVADQFWLSAYWQIIDKIPGDGFLGPVLPRLEATAPHWMDINVFFGRPRYASGTPLMSAEQTRTGNAFIRRSLLDKHRFDPCYGLTGGEDSELFARMLNDNAVFYWCNEAVVLEYIPPGRTSLSWLLRRSFRVGNTYTLVQKSVPPHILNQMFGFVKASVGLLLFTIILVFELICGPKRATRRMMRIAVQAGHLYAFLNIKYQEYKIST